MKGLAAVLGVVLLAAAGCAKGPDTDRFELGPQDVVEATVVQGADGTYSVSVTLTQAASERLTRLTTENIGKKLSLVVGGDVVSEPVVREVIPGPKLTIACRGKEDAERIVETLTK